MPKHRPPPLRALRAFCAAARLRSFKLAADELFVTPSAISHQMKELESHLGVRLFERKTRALELTVPGRALLEQTEPLLEALERVVATVARGGRRRTLRVSMPPFFASELFVPRLASFYRLEPTVHIRIDSPEPLLTAHPANCDASILLVETPPAELYARKLFSMRLCAVCSRELAASARTMGKDLFQSVALIVNRTRPDAWARWAAENGHDEPDPDHVIELDTQFAVARAAERGLGIALLPTTLCDPWLRSGALVRLDARELVTPESYFLVVRPDDAEREEIRALTHWALKELGHVGSRDALAA
jgi:LysR family glycine cleavage system transcriptional activator